MIGVDVDNGTKYHQSKFFEGFDHGEKFFFDGGVIVLGFVELACIEGNWTAFFL